MIKGEVSSRLNHWIFWPPFTLLIVTLIFSQVAKEDFLKLTTRGNIWILDHFDWLFSYTSFFMVILCAIIFLSPLGKIKIGGERAKPILTKWRWFSIILCTTIAVGILFWGVSEPLYHLSGPPNSHGAEAGSMEAFAFSMSTMFMHWSFTPYAIYAIPALMFAIGFYNRKQSFSLTTMLFPFNQSNRGSFLESVISGLCLFALVAGMSAALGAGVLSLAGGLAKVNVMEVNWLSLGLMTLLIVGAFTISAASGLLKGIRLLSGFNLVIFLLLCVFVVVVGPAESMVRSFSVGITEYVQNFVPQSLGLGQFSDSDWTHSWTTFYWAIWMAWAPVTCLFLGRISYGYTVRQFFLFNWVIPSIFSIIWMSIFSGISLHLEMSGELSLVETLNQSGPESIIYEILEYLPLTGIAVGLFLLTMFISYVTAADSSTEAMSGLSAQGISPESPDPPRFIKYMWGGLIGLVAWVMVSYSGIDGVRMLSNLGGLPALFLLLPVSVGALVWCIRNWNKKGS